MDLDLDMNTVAVSLGLWLIILVMIWKMQMWQGDTDPWKFNIAASVIMLPITYIIVVAFKNK